MDELDTFEAPLELMGLDADRVVEIALSGPGSVIQLIALGKTLGGVSGLELHPYERRGADFAQLLVLAGAAGSLASGLDVLWGWLCAARLFGPAREAPGFELKVRTRRGEVRLSADDPREARRLLNEVQAALRVQDRE